MKRIVCLLILVLTTLLSSTCFAFRDPDPNQWFFYSQNGTLDIWMHKTDVSRYQNNNKNGYYDPHYGHVYYTFWVLMQDNDTKEEIIFRNKIDIQCRTITNLQSVKYDENGKVLNSYINPYPQPEPVVPGSIAAGYCDYWMKMENANKGIYR